MLVQAAEHQWIDTDKIIFMCIPKDAPHKTLVLVEAGEKELWLTIHDRIEKVEDRLKKADINDSIS